MAEEKKITIRIPLELHEDLLDWCEEDVRSLNGEIVVLLREAIASRNRDSVKLFNKENQPCILPKSTNS